MRSIEHIDEAMLSRDVFGRFSPTTLALAACTCVAWKDIASAEALWKPHVQRLTKSNFEQLQQQTKALRAEPGVGWRQVLKRLTELNVTGKWHVKGTATMLDENESGRSCPAQYEYDMVLTQHGLAPGRGCATEVAITGEVKKPWTMSISEGHLSGTSIEFVQQQVDSKHRNMCAGFLSLDGTTISGAWFGGEDLCNADMEGGWHAQLVAPDITSLDVMEEGSTGLDDDISSTTVIGIIATAIEADADMDTGQENSPGAGDEVEGNLEEDMDTGA